MLIFGSGLAFFLGDPFIEPIAPPLSNFELGNWSSIPQIQSALKISPLSDPGHCPRLHASLVFY